MRTERVKPYITMEEVIREQGEGKHAYKFLTAENGCLSGCASGVTVYGCTEFPEKMGCHEDQEGFYVLEGEGVAKLDDMEFPIKQGDSFIALPGVRHTIKSDDAAKPVKVFWFHSAV